MKLMCRSICVLSAISFGGNIGKFNILWNKGVIFIPKGWRQKNTHCAAYKEKYIYTFTVNLAYIFKPMILYHTSLTSDIPQE